MSLVVVDADVLGRRRTGDETYVRNLLRTLPGPAAEAGLDLAAVTRRPDLVPEGVLPVLLSARSQELRMAWTLPRALRRLGAALVHTQYALPLRCPCPAVVTIHDLSFERGLMGRRDRIVFERVVPRAARGAARVLTVSERTKHDLVELYAIPPERIVVTPNGVDPAFAPRADGASNSLLQAPYAARGGGDPGAEEPARGARGGTGGGPRARRRRTDARTRRSRASYGRAARASRGTSPPSGSRRSTAAPPASSRHRVTRASASRSSRPWPPGRRS